MTLSSLAYDEYGSPIQAMKPGTTQTIAVGASSVASASAVGATINVVRLIATTNCFVKFGAGSPAATTSDTPLFANQEVYFRVDEGQGIKVAVIQMSAGGTLYMTEML